LLKALFGVPLGCAHFLGAPHIQGIYLKFKKICGVQGLCFMGFKKDCLPTADKNAFG